MDRKKVLSLLKDVASGVLPAEKALDALRFAPVAALAQGVALDTHRSLRTGLAEVVFAAGKSPDRLCAALEGLHQANGKALATRVDPERAAILKDRFPQGDLFAEAGLFALGLDAPLDRPSAEFSDLAVVSAGASDAPVALEAVGTARFFGFDPVFLPDMGVAGLHRIAPHLARLDRAKIAVVVAGMEGALPSVLAGLTGLPIIAVPTSVGYGASFGGIAALLGMLNSCAPGVVVVNIDNGFGAATAAIQFLNRRQSSSGDPA